MSSLSKIDFFLITTDVASLYPNVDIRKAVVDLDPLRREAREPQTPLVVQLARPVFEKKKYLTSEFSPGIF